MLPFNALSRRMYGVYWGEKSQRELALVLLYRRSRRTGYDVLLGALNESEIGERVDFYLVDGDRLIREGELGKLVWLVRSLSARYRTVMLLAGFFTTDFVSNYEFYRRLPETKRVGDNVILLAGGPHPSGDPIGTLRVGFDFAFVGEAEESLIHFTRAVLEGEDYLETRGICFISRERDGTQEVVFTGRPSPASLDEHPPFAPKKRLFNEIEITRGCPFACAFCQTPFIFGGKPRHRSVENIVKWAEFMAKLGKKDIRFITPNALSYGSASGISPNYHAVQEFLDRLHRVVRVGYGGRIFFGSFPSEVRPEFVDEDVLKFVRARVSNDRIVVGVQSGSDRILNLIRRRHTVEEAISAVRAVTKAGFLAEADFIFGLPFETREDYEETLKVIERLVGMGAVIRAHVFLPLPGTPLGDLDARPIPLYLKKNISKLTGAGKLRGAWRNQEKLSFMISTFRSRGIILPTKLNYALLSEGRMELD